MECNPYKLYVKKERSWDKKLYGHLVNQVFLPHYLPFPFQPHSPHPPQNKTKQTLSVVLKKEFKY